MIAIIDYGMGNLRSVEKAFEKVGFDTVVTDKSEIIENADKIVLPGVGAFKDAIDGLQERNLIEPIKNHVKQIYTDFFQCIVADRWSEFVRM